MAVLRDAPEGQAAVAKPGPGSLCRSPGGTQLQDDQEVLELVEKLQPQRTRLGFDQPVLAVLR
jgi:hypothetical protein